jgi:hypothetical protein
MSARWIDPARAAETLAALAQRVDSANAASAVPRLGDAAAIKHAAGRRMGGAP